MCTAEIRLNWHDGTCNSNWIRFLGSTRRYCLIVIACVAYTGTVGGGEAKLESEEPASVVVQLARTSPQSLN